MDKLIPIIIPLLNPNEPEALLASIEVEQGSKVSKGETLALIETTKSTGEILSEADGFLVGMRFQAGDTLTVGEVLGYIGSSPDAQDPTLPPWAAEGETTQNESSLTGLPLRVTAPARKLALESGLDLETLPHGPLVTRQMVQALLAPQAPLTSGAFEVIGFLDDGLEPGNQVLNLTVLGGEEKLDELAKDGIHLAVNGVGGIGDLPSRLKVFNRLSRAGFFTPTAIHPTAFIEGSAVLGDGVQVFPFAYIGTEVEVGYGCIINTGAIVSHDCRLFPYVNLSPGATLAGGVTVGEGALIGMRATVNLYVKVGSHALIGNGATVKADVPDGGVVPAGTIWPPRR
jgi:sugar O-acyltransferase (sialic acid O-acetyltransferase NeuD family)